MQTIGDDRQGVKTMRQQIPGSQDIVNIGTHRQLFVDNHIIETSRWITPRTAETARWTQPHEQERTDLDRIDGWDRGAVKIAEDVPGHLIRATAFVTRTWNQPERFEGNPIMTRGCPWEGESTPWPCRIMHDEEEGLWKMWYNGHHREDIPGDVLRSGHVYRCMYATSHDGIHWERPSLDVVTDTDGTATNIVYEGKTQYVVKDTTAHPSRRYKMGQMMVKDGRKLTMLWHSPDGIHWTPDAGPFTYGRGDENLSVMVDPVSRKYIGFCRPARPNRPGPVPRLERSIVRMQSNDLVQWSMCTPIVVQDELDPLGTEFEGMIGTFYEEMYLGFLRQVDPAHNTADVWLAHSRDGFHWQRPRAKPFLGRGPEGSWDAKSVTLQEPPFRVGDKLWLYYTGTDKAARPGIGLGKIRVDGLVSIDAPPNDRSPKNNPPTLTTKALYSPGNRLVVNVDASAGHIEAELIDVDGFAIAGYSRKDCERFTEDSLAHTFTWNGNADIGECIPVRIRFYMEKTKLYALQIPRE
jgi:hypothetical protein